VQPYQPPAAPSVAPGVGEMRKPDGPPFLASYGGVVALCFVIWGVSCLASGDFIYPWPLWMLIPLIFGLLGRFANRNR
jgi:hypothetical protein